jgi:hypothetical protein
MTITKVLAADVVPAAGISAYANGSALHSLHAFLYTHQDQESAVKVHAAESRCAARVKFAEKYPI